MNYEIIPSDEFKKNVKALNKKYRNIKQDIGLLAEELLLNPFIGTELGNNTYKIRLKNRDNNKGKSAGYRIITYVVNKESKIFLISMYSKSENKATVFGYYVKDSERYGVAEFDDAGNVTSIEEKPSEPKSNYAVIGLYFYPNDVVKKAKDVKPSNRGELEITTLNQDYLNEERLKVELMGRGYAWLDTGTQESLLEASMFIQTIENRQGLKVACLEEIAFEMGYISKEKLLELAEPLKKNQYGQYLISRAEQ